MTIQILSLCILTAAVTAAGAEDGRTDPAKKRSGRPAHMADISAAGYSGHTDLWDLRCRVDDRLFTLDNSLPVYNSFRADSFRTNSIDGVPSRLYSISDSVTAQSDRYTFMGMVSSAGDRPFSRMDDTFIMGIAGRQIWSDGAHSAAAAVFFSTMDIYGWYVPIPFVNYSYKDNTLILLAGLPTMVFWKIRSDLQFSFSYFPTLNIESSLIYKPLPFLSIGPEIAFKQDKYSEENRTDREEHLFHRYAYIGMTIQSYISSFAGVYLSAGAVPYNVYYRSRYSWEWGPKTKGTADFVCRTGIKLFAF